jgi:hypothetical protein
MTFCNGCRFGRILFQLDPIDPTGNNLSFFVVVRVIGLWLGWMLLYVVVLCTIDGWYLCGYYFTLYHPMGSDRPSLLCNLIRMG